MNTQSLANEQNLIPIKRAHLLRIIFQLFVLFHHLYQTQTQFGKYVSWILGPSAVAGFLFLSGYGVAVSFKRDGEEYLSKFIKKRIPSTYLTIVVVDVIYLSLFYLQGNSFTSFTAMLCSLLYLPVVKGYVALSHWVYFLADLLIYYVIFYVVMKVLKNKQKRLEKTAVVMLVLSAIAIAVLTVINVNTGSSRYLRGIILFPIGILCACYNDAICKLLSKYKWWVVGGLAVAFLLSAIFTVNSNMATEYLICTFATLLVVALLFGVEVKSKAVSFFSDKVLIVYLSHEYILFYLRMHLHAQEDWVLIMFLTLVISLAISIILRLIQCKCKKALSSSAELNAQKI